MNCSTTLKWSRRSALTFALVAMALGCGDYGKLEKLQDKPVPDCGGQGKGGLGCACSTGQDCQLYATCLAGVCSDMRSAPKTPSCYTPCRSGALIDGEFRECAPDGLMRGCIGTAQCENGTCIAGADSDSQLAGNHAGGAPPDDESAEDIPGACSVELDCPSHQTCISGACFSECEGGSECPDDLDCYRHVCRLPCSLSDTDSRCPANSFCASLDGESGYCEQESAAAETRQSSVDGAFELSTRSLGLSNVTNSASFVITNRSLAPMEFEVQKVSHQEFDDEGSQEELERPLFWLNLVEGGVENCKNSSTESSEDASAVEPLLVLIAGGGGESKISVCNATNEELTLWNGEIHVGNERLGYQKVGLSYTSSADGQWSGHAYYFANFGTDNLEEWAQKKQNPSSNSVLSSVGNALVWRWDAMRRGQISLDNFKAALRSAISGSWSSPTMRDRCPELAGACYPYDDADGLESFSNDLTERPIPSGVAELPVTVNLRAKPDTPHKLAGRFESHGTLHYAGNPAVKMELSLPSQDCDERFPEACLNFLHSFQSTVSVGGRYYPAIDEPSCRVAGYKLLEVPWLPEGFQGGVRTAMSGTRYHRECRATSLPFADSSMSGFNQVFAGSNPIPDGRARVREVELIDGILVNQEQVLLLFKESFNVGEPGEEPFVAHGVMLLGRVPATLDPSAFNGSKQGEVDVEVGDLSPPVRCSERVVREALNTDTLPDTWSPVPDTDLAINDLAHALITGKAPGDATLTLDVVGQVVHYLCHDTGLFDGGANDTGLEGGTKIDCPVGSRVTYFSMVAGRNCGDQESVADLPCQEEGQCEPYLFQELPAAKECYLQLRPTWACADGQRYCDKDRSDLRADKVFYADSETAVFLPLHNTVDEAFLYKTAFVSRKDKNLGFVPALCDEGGSSIPYCYDPVAIESASERIDCALSLYVNHSDALSNENHAELREALELNFSVERGPSQKEGFESLFSELSIMLGDDAYTAAFASRFDLGNTQTRSFEGELFEQDGINLSGVAGFEMHSLYLATQYYQMALDRFYALMPLIRESITHQRENAGDGFISQETVTNYFDRLIRASSQKARAWSEVAKHYESFNQPELARRVVEPAYTATYMESVLIARLMHEVSEVVKASDVAQIDLTVAQALRFYKAALLDMRDVYSGISDDRTLFGYSQDYIPFPALDPGDINAFEKLMAAAWKSVDFARDKEDRALSKARDFDVDEESFQAELVSIRNTYEGQLGDLCGLFPVPPSGQLYLPAIAKYAHHWDVLARLGNPCGAIGSGAIHEAVVNQSQKILELDGIFLRRGNKQKEIRIEADRIDAHCESVLDGIEGIAALAAVKQRVATTLKAGELVLSTYDTFRETGKDAVKLAQCEPPTVGTAVSPGTCVQVSAAMAIEAAADLPFNIFKTALAGSKFAAEESIAIVETAKAIAGLEGQCDLARIDSAARIKLLALEKAEIQQDIVVKVGEVALAESQVTSLRSQAKRLQMEQTEIEQLAINIESARNDPNARIYKNDAVISADRSFQRALAAAYRATKVYEYYTSQSYARLDNLFLIRMVQAGDFNLEDYLFELEGEYVKFEESYGNPDHRVAILSLRDDIWAIPRIDSRGQAVSEHKRQVRLRERLADPQLLDARGHLSIAFSTALDVLSPLTRNHKIRHIEAEFVGADLGDSLGRIYLRQRGTGTVRAVGGDKIFYAMPEKTAVVDTFFNGERFGVFSDTQVLRNERFRDLPFANTAWELVINQRDEFVNQDINLRSLSDVRLYIYYTDFTEL